ncbi:hypothetical protein BGX28_009289 [Mortierella sp. GBA30]|nr:hypothetical protein BGX28_009289 [Mortierella sp. GBA30]
MQQMQKRHAKDLHATEQDPVLRTSSLSRIASSSPSPRGAQALGLSRSKSVSVAGAGSQSFTRKGRGPGLQPSSESGRVKSVVSECKFLATGFRLIKRTEKAALEGTPTSEADNACEHSPGAAAASPITAMPMVQAQESATSLSRKKTLKDLGPSLRSLARRCSSRFGSRPSSYAGSSSDPVLQLSEGKVATGSLSMRTSHASSITSHDFTRQPRPEPHVIADLQQWRSELQLGSISGPSPVSPSIANDIAPERVPIHRRVTLFRSKTTTLAGTRTAASTNAIHTAETTPPNATNGAASPPSPPVPRSKSVRMRPQSILRLANGRGLDLDMLQPKPITDSPGPIHGEQSACDLKSSMVLSDPSMSATGLYSSLAHTDDDDPQEAVRRQVLALLALGRKERISAKTGQVIPQSPSLGLSSAAKQEHLSPLALEAQEELPHKTDAVSQLKEQKNEEEDPCERIAFMLVPKSRYEFQPLVVV